MTIKEAREKAGMSRAEMSRVFEIPLRTLEDWDAKKSSPPPYVQKLIIEKLLSFEATRKAR
jgi:DNA-binding transcriptional regulator YiaG